MNYERRQPHGRRIKTISIDTGKIIHKSFTGNPFREEDKSLDVVHFSTDTGTWKCPLTFVRRQLAPPIENAARWAALLGYSPTAQYYAISGLDEAKEYISHPVLGERLREISSALLGWRATPFRITLKRDGVACVLHPKPMQDIFWNLRMQQK